MNSFILKEFGKKVKYLRNKLGLSQEGLANKTGFHRTYIGMIERGERNISLTNLVVFAKAFDISIDELLRFENSKALISNYQVKS